MGGPVRIVVREPLGGVYCVNTWTGSIPWFFDNARFLNDDPGLLGQLINYNDGLTNILAPDGYGLVVGDRQEKVILTCQNYLTPGSVFSSSIRMSWNGRILGEDKGERSCEIFEELYENGRINTLKPLDRDKPLIDISHLSYEEFYKAYSGVDPGWKNHFGAEYPSDWFAMIDTDPYTIEVFEVSSRGLRKMRSRLWDLDFPINDLSLAIWEEYLEEREEQEEDEAKAIQDL